MKKKELLFIFAICLIIFTPFFVRPSFIGADSYYYVNHICFRDTIFSEPFIETFLFDLFPCNFFVLKIVMFFCFFVSMLLMALIVEDFFKEKGWLSVFFVYGLSPILFFLVFKLENDFIGYTLLVLSILFYFKSIKHKYDKKFFIYTAISLIVLYISAQISAINYFFLYVGAVNNPIFLLSLIIGITTTQGTALTQLIPYFEVAEMFPLLGLTTIFLLFLAWIKPLHKKEMFVATILATLQGRFIFLIPIIYAPSLMSSLDYLNSKKKVNVYLFVGIYAIVGILAFSILTLDYFPEQNTFDIVLESISLAEDNNLLLYNDWEIGYLIRNQKYYTTYRGSPPNPDYNNLEKPFLALTKQKSECEKIFYSNNYTLVYCK